MLVTVFCQRRDRSELTFSLEVDPDLDLKNFRALCELESEVPARESTLTYAEEPLTDNRRSLASYGLKDGDVVVLRQQNIESRQGAPLSGMPRIDFSGIAVPGSSDQQSLRPTRSSPPDSTTSPQGLDNPAMLREMLLSNPHELSLLKERNPPLAEALLSGDLEKFTRVLLEQQQERARREQERIRLFSADPFDLDAQARIEEDIRQQNIEENMTIAMEEAPESFGQVVMLYINCKVNGYPVKAFVDSGAQMTIMSQACAERCHIMRLVDRRWAGIAKGVGTQKIIGRVHLAQVQIEGDFLPCSFSILEEQPMDMLLGLDMLKRHQCSIDLKNNFVLIGTTGTRTPFLPEGELPDCARLAYGPGREDMHPEELADQELAEALQKSVDEAEHGDEETTSLEMPLLPTTDVLNKADKSSGSSFNPLGPLEDRFVSAQSPVCLPESKAAENVESQALELSESAAACQVSTEGDTSKPLFDRSASTNSSIKAGEADSHNHAISLQNIFQNSGNLENAYDNKPCIVDSMENDFHVAAADMFGEGLMATADKAIVSEHLGMNQKKPSSNFQELDLALNNFPIVTEQKQHNDQILTSTDGDPRFLMEQVEGFDDPNQASHVEVSGELQKTHLKQNGQLLPSIKESTIPHMEIDHAVHSPVPIEEISLTRDSDTNVGAFGFDPQWSEMDMLKVGCALPGSLRHPLSSGDLSESIRINRVDTESHKQQSLSPYFQSKPTSSGVSLTTPDLGTQGEEPGQSLASALKELHKLLIVNSREDSRRPLTEAEDCSQCDLVVDVQAEQIADTEKDIDRKILLTSADMQPGDLENVALDTQFEAPPYFTQAQGRNCISVSGHHTPANINITQQIEEVGRLDIAFVPDSAERSIEQTDFSPLQELSETPEASNDISESNKPIPSTHTSITDFHVHSASSTKAMLPKMVEDLSKPEAVRPLKREVEISSQLPVCEPVASAAVQSPQFPATAVRQILGAGFSLQEALAALEHAGGNADLALLVLLARNIVVPS